MNARGEVALEDVHIEHGHRLGTGGQGSVWVVDDDRETAFKEYHPTFALKVDHSFLLQLIGLPDRLPREEAAWVLAHTAWPRAAVMNRGSVRGVLMKRAPERFSFDANNLVRGTTRRQFSLEFLLNSDSYTAALGLHVDVTQRIRLLLNLAKTLELLHSAGVAVGDLSPKNILVTNDSARECFLIDCDSFSIGGISALPQTQTVDWQSIDGEAKSTPEGDSYKFGLLVARLFNRDQTSLDLSLLTSDRSALAALVRRSFSETPGARPTLAEWRRSLQEEVGSEGRRWPSAPPIPAPSKEPPRNSASPATSGACAVLVTAAVVVIVLLIAGLIASH